MITDKIDWLVCNKDVKKFNTGAGKLNISSNMTISVRLVSQTKRTLKRCDGSMVEQLVLNPEVLGLNPSCSCFKIAILMQHMWR